MRHRNLIRLLALGLSASLLLSGCGGGEEEKSPSPSPSESESESVPPEDAPKDYSKYNAYLKLSDQMSDMLAILDVYFGNVEYAPDFALLAGGDYAAIKEAADFYIANTYSVEQALEYADKEPAYTRLDAAVRALGDSPVKLMEAIEDLSGYTQFNEFEEDDLARAPEIHAAIWEQMQVFSTYYGEFMDAVDELAKEKRGDDLEDLKKQDQMILYYSSVMIFSSQDIEDNIWGQMEAAINEAEYVLPALDMTELTPLFTDFKQSYEALIGAMGDEEQQKKVFSGPTAEPAMKLYTNKVESLYSWMTRLEKTIQDGGDYTEDLLSMGDAISSMIDGYNSII